MDTFQERGRASRVWVVSSAWFAGAVLLAGCGGMSGANWPSIDAVGVEPTSISKLDSDVIEASTNVDSLRFLTDHEGVSYFAAQSARDARFRCLVIAGERTEVACGAQPPLLVATSAGDVVLSPARPSSAGAPGVIKHDDWTEIGEWLWLSY